MNTREIGKQGEYVAKKFLQEKGYRIQEENFWARYGEVDIIAYEGDYLVFIEVKLVRGDSFVEPQQQVDYQKQTHLRRVANYYLIEHNLEVDCRFDVVAISQIQKDYKIELIRNAFLV
ncbi:YraN family protein [Halanaerocella petrolearia]